MQPIISDSSTPAASDPEPVAVTLEQQEEKKSQGFGDMLKKAAGRAGIIGEGAVNVEISEGPKPRGRGRPLKGAQRDEFCTLVVAVLTLGVSFSNMPDNLQPNDAEIKGLAWPISGLLLRHLPISGKLTDDAVDIIAILATLGSWYGRIAPDLKAARKEQPPRARVSGDRNNGAHPPEEPTDGERVSKAAADYLEDLHGRTA